MRSGATCGGVRGADVLCAALREPRLPEQEALLRSLTTKDWEALAALAVHQRVASLISANTRPWIPEATLRTLRARAQFSATRALRYQAEFVQLARAVAPHGIPLIVLKGLHLATSVYHSPASREMNDFDVLVRLADVDHVLAAARELGYTPMQEMETAVAESARHHLPRLLKPGVGLEIHWRLAPPGKPPAAPPEDLWARARPFRLADNAFVLCPEDALVHICAHATISHFFEQGVRPLCDIRAPSSPGTMTCPGMP